MMTDTAAGMAGQSGSTGCGLSDPAFNNLLLAGLECGVEVEYYLAGRAGGLSHDAIVDLDRNCVDIADYLRAVRTGASHEQFCEAWLVGIASSDYADAREVGMAQGDLVAARVRGIGATHREVYDVVDTNVDSGVYKKARRVLKRHDEAMSAAMCGSLEHYLEERSNGAPWGQPLR